MDKSYIIRIYEQRNESVDGIVEDVERRKRERFSNSEQLWSLVTDKANERSVSNVIKPAIFNAVQKKSAVSD